MRCNIGLRGDRGFSRLLVQTILGLRMFYFICTIYGLIRSN